MIKKLRKKIRFWKRLIFEVLETLCTICLYLEYDGRHSHNPYHEYMGSHIRTLKSFSRELYSEVKKDG